MLVTSTSWRKLISAGSVESQYLYLVSSVSPSGHSISSHSSATCPGIAPLYPTRTRTRAKREDNQSAEPSRHLIVRQACLGRARATSLAEIRSGSPRRPLLLSDLSGRFGPVPGATSTRS